MLPGQNFNIPFSIVSLGGRGLSANLTLYYNSNVWGARYDANQGANVFTFDPIQSWPSPGFSLGFGRIAYYDWQYDPTYGGVFTLMWVEPNGARHLLGQGPQNTSATYQTTDGSHMTYVGSVLSGGILYYQDGSKVTIGLVNNRLLTTQITDSNGNYIQIAYKSSSQGFAPQAIDYVTDTLGRVIQFNYSSDLGNRLIGISPPTGYATSFSYQTVTMNTNFANPIENVGSSFLGISGITAPNRPPYQLSYSGYGMVYGLSWSSSGISGGVSYNYPLA